MTILPLVVALAAAQAPAAAADRVAVNQPQTVATIDLGKVKGEPLRLSWSPDKSQLYVFVGQPDGRGGMKSAKHFVVTIADKQIKGVDAEPAWSSKYWAWKSGQASPAAPAFRIAVDSRHEAVHATAMPTGGSLARGVPDTSGTGSSTVEDVNRSAMQNQGETIYTLRVGGEKIGEWTNEPVMPGVNFGWAPAPAHLLAFTKRDGGPIVVLDDQAHKHELTEAKDATLPAWSDDGTELAWAERTDRKHATIRVADVTMR